MYIIATMLPSMIPVSDSCKTVSKQLKRTNWEINPRKKTARLKKLNTLPGK